MDISEFQGKKMILIIPPDYGIAEVMKYNMEQMGLECLVISKPFVYKNLLHRIKNWLLKTIFKDRSFKTALAKQYNFEELISKTSSLNEKADYVLIIRPDTIPLKHTNSVLALGKKVVAYQWDGLDRYPEIFDYIAYYKNFYIFDKNDYQKYKNKYPNLKLCASFYFDDDLIEGEPSIKNSAYYVGVYYKDRIDDLLLLIKELEKYDLEIDINLSAISQRKFLYNKKHIKFNKYNFAQNLKKTIQAKVLLDFKATAHSGLSLRFFEALKYEKKIITNNATVAQYDFYNPKNIFILHKDSLDNLGEFLNTDYCKLPEHIVKKYAFSAWLWRVFEDEYTLEKNQEALKKWYFKNQIEYE